MLAPEPLGDLLTVYLQRGRSLTQELLLILRGPRLLRRRLLLLLLSFYLFELFEAVNVNGDFPLLEQVRVLLSMGDPDALGVYKVAVLINLGRQEARPSAFKILPALDALIPLDLQFLLAHEAAVLVFRIWNDVFEF